MITIPDKKGNSYQNISHAMQERGRENNECCKGHLNVDALKEKAKIKKNRQFYTTPS